MTSTVLVVDDNEALAENVAELFEDAGAEVEISTDLESALGSAGARPPDLAIVDVRLPGGRSGLDVVSRLRQSAPHGEVILITGSASLDTAIDAVRHGVFAYVRKPFDPEDLLALGERALAQVTLRKERQALARDLAASEALYRGVVESVDQLILGLDEQGRITLANPFSAEVAGTAVDDLVGRSFVEVAARLQDRRIAMRLLEQVRAGGAAVRDRELPLPRADGTTRLVRWSVLPLPVGSDKSRLLAVGLDVTDRLELERRTAQSEALATIGALTAGLAHEIRNPLNAAKLQLELLARGAARLPDAEAARSLGQRVEIVKQEIGRLSAMLDEFLALARPRGLERGPVELAALVEEVAELEAPVAAAVGIQIGVTCERVPLHASGDRGKLKQVLVNLVSNAIEAIRGTGRGGRITLGVRPADAAFLEVSVADTGPGVSAEIESKMFEPFFTTKEAGTGLGLPVVKRIVELHGGVISVDAAPEGGAVVRFTVPRAE